MSGPSSGVSAVCIHKLVVCWLYSALFAGSDMPALWPKLLPRQAGSRAVRRAAGFGPAWACDSGLAGFERELAARRADVITPRRA